MFLMNWICYFNNFALLEVKGVAMFQVYLNFFMIYVKIKVN